MDKYDRAAVCNLVFGNDLTNCLDIRLIGLDIGVRQSPGVYVPQPGDPPPAVSVLM